MKLEYYKLLSNVACNCNLRQYRKVISYASGGAIVPPQFPYELCPLEGKSFKFRIVYYRVPPPGATDGAAAIASKSSQGGFHRKFSFGGRKNEQQQQQQQ